jgi:hypothetical protein
MQRCFVCGCDHRLKSKTRGEYNKSRCDAPQRVGYALDYVTHYHKAHKTLEGCYEAFVGDKADVIEEAAKIFHSWIRNRVTYDEAKKVLLHHLVCETIEGYVRELEIANLIESKASMRLEHADKQDDYDYGVDFWAYARGTNFLVGGIQIKPISWKYGTAPDIITAKRALDEKFAKCMRDKGVRCLTVMVEDGNIIKMSKNIS